MKRVPRLRWGGSKAPPFAGTLPKASPFLPRQIANGYMIGACLAEYHTGKITREDFNGGHSPVNKAANWEFVQKFMRRRGFSLCQDDIDCLCAVSR